ncbi:MAG: naringenin-chalcone synthase [Oligoflexia bacterium]|nr:naringenin-chalcone synthase [Oligoflexia bacterium]
MIFLSELRSLTPRYLTPQEKTLEWLALAHHEAERKAGHAGERADFERLAHRFGCAPAAIAFRGHELEDFTHLDFARMRVFGASAPAQGAGASVRSELFGQSAARAFEALLEGTEAPEALLHVTCTGIRSPSAAQELVGARGWGTRTEVTHAYQMGCYAAIPAVRLAEGALLRGAREARIVHTELCTLHLNPAEHAPEQWVLQSLFADGFIAYLATAREPAGPAFGVLASAEHLLPGTAEAMRWNVSEWGMRMSLARSVPAELASALPTFLETLFYRAGLSFEREAASCRFAIHPGGPRIIESAREALGLREDQVAASRAVLRERGNMSSATLPHVWARLAHDPDVREGDKVASLAFGPGLTLCGLLLEKRGNSPRESP